jgi:hypothetical protein
LVATRDCYLLMTSVIQDHGLVYTDDILVKVVAVNARGYSVVSESNLVAPQVQDIPRKMLTCTQMSETTNTVVAFEWQVPDNGGSEIIGYLIQVKHTPGQEEYVELIKDYHGLLQYQITSDVVEGAIYEIILKAENKWGYATEFSEPCSILAATTPEKVENL